MGEKAGSSSESRKRHVSFTTALASAVLEWLLIFMLLVYGVCGYLITKFARYCELPIPCLLCSRIDHILGSEKVGFYWDLICNNHKLEISSSVFCHFHEKLVDVRGMCETCLFSFATKDKSNAETYRLLVGKLGAEELSDTDEETLQDDHKPKNSSTKHCSCCNELWNSRCHAQTMFQNKSSDFDAADLVVPLSREFGQYGDDLNRKTTYESEPLNLARGETEDSSAQTMLQTKSIGFDAAELDVLMNREFVQFGDDLHNEAKSPYESAAPITHIRGETEDSSAHCGYTELKISSDTESEIQAFDNEDTRALMLNDPLRDLILDSAQVEPFISDSSFNKLIDLDVLSREPSQALCEVQSNIIQLCYDPSVASAPSIGHGLEDLKNSSDTESEIQAFDNEDTRALILNDPLRDLILDSVQEEHFITVSEDDSAFNKPIDLEVLSREPSQALCEVQSDIMQLCDDPSVASAPAIGHGLEELNWQGIDQNLDQSASTKIIDVNPVLESSNAENVSTDISKDGLDTKEADVVQTLAHETETIQELENSQITTDFNSSNMRSDPNDCGFQTPNYLDLGDAYKLAVSSRGRQLSGKLAEQLAGKESSRVSGEMKLLLSQVPRGFDLPSNDTMSPRLSRNLDELKTYDSNASIGMKLLQKRFSLERNDSRTSLDRNESGLESLDFSTVSEIEGESELDRLKRQLEHDRKFMIVLLRELEEERNASAIATNEAMAMITRLQEEKAALQMEASHDLRMMEEQAEYDMEALEKLNDLVAEKDREIQDLEAELEHLRTNYPNESESFLENAGESVSDASQDENPRSASNYSYCEGPGHGVDMAVLAEDSKKDSWLEIEDESEYILKCLNNLEKKLNLLSLDNTVHSNLGNGDHLENQGDDTCDLKSNEEDPPQMKNEMDENDVVISSKDGFVSKGSHLTLVRRVPSFLNLKQGSLIHKEADLVALGSELSNLHGRLQALEADRHFLERAIVTLKNGDEGLIQEIASHLRELRKIGIRIHEVLS